MKFGKYEAEKREGTYNDVVGYLTEDEVGEILEKIEALPKA